MPANAEMCDFATRVRSLFPLTGCDGVVGPCTSRNRGQQHGASQQPESASRGSRDTLDTLLTDHRGTGWTRGCATGIPTEGCTERACFSTSCIIPSRFPPRADASDTRASVDSWATPTELRLNPTHLSLINRWRLIIPLPYASQPLRFRGRSQPVARSSRALGVCLLAWAVRTEDMNARIISPRRRRELLGFCSIYG